MNVEERILCPASEWMTLTCYMYKPYHAVPTGIDMTTLRITRHIVGEDNWPVNIVERKEKNSVLTTEDMPGPDTIEGASNYQRTYDIFWNLLSSNIIRDDCPIDST